MSAPDKAYEVVLLGKLHCHMEKRKILVNSLNIYEPTNRKIDNGIRERSSS